MADGFMGKLKNLVGIEEIEDDDEDDLEPVPAPPRPAERSYSAAPKYSARPQEESRLPLKPAPGAAGRETKPFKMVVIEPAGFDDCSKLVDSLKARKPVIINLESVESDVARKIFDFLSGATYALSGNVQKISNNIFVFAPESVDITAISEREVSYTEAMKTPWR
jgi:cell division inhibitor SepF